MPKRLKALFGDLVGRRASIIATLASEVHCKLVEAPAKKPLPSGRPIEPINGYAIEDHLRVAEPT